MALKNIYKLLFCFWTTLSFDIHKTHHYRDFPQDYHGLVYNIEQLQGSILKEILMYIKL